jgi:hypothetical protein
MKHGLFAAAVCLIVLCAAGSARADSTYIDPALTDGNTFCWDTTFNMFVYCSPIDWGTNPDPNSGGGSTDQQCPKVTSYDTCVQNCDCVYSNNKKKCGTSPTCLDMAAAERNACLGGCLSDWS